MNAFLEDEREVQHRRRKTLSYCALGLVVATLGRVAHAEEGRFLTRSLYVPIEFRLCEHLAEAVFYQDGQAISLLPVKRIFQFTYYPDLGRQEPSQVDIRVEGRYAGSGEPFKARMALSPGGLHTAREHKTLGLERLVKQFRFHRDVHSKETVLRLACEKFCARSESASFPATDGVTATFETGASGQP